jgi:hypothetical protein
MIEQDQADAGKYGRNGTVKPERVFSQAPSPWQPIETAPRDGTEIIGVFHRRYDEISEPDLRAMDSGL